MLCALHTYHPWSLDLFIHVPFQLFFLENTALAAISALGSNHTHCHLCPTRYSFTPESSRAYEGKVPCPRTQHQNNVPILRGEKHVISLKILHQAGFWNHTTGSDIAKAQRSSHYVTSLSHCNLHSLQAAKCCRNSRLVVNEDDLTWVKMRKYIISIKTVLVYGQFFYAAPLCKKLSHSSIQNDTSINIFFIA